MQKLRNTFSCVSNFVYMLAQECLFLTCSLVENIRGELAYHPLYSSACPRLDLSVGQGFRWTYFQGLWFKLSSDFRSFGNEWLKRITLFCLIMLMLIQLPCSGGVLMICLNKPVEKQRLGNSQVLNLHQVQFSL